MLNIILWLRKVYNIIATSQQKEMLKNSNSNSNISSVGGPVIQGLQVRNLHQVNFSQCLFRLAVVLMALRNQ